MKSWFSWLARQLYSRKFWALVIAVVTAASGAYLGDITWLAAREIVIAALLTFIGAVSLEDGLSRRS